jgi:uncharacterized SAM-dependent methyltransferase
MSYQQNAVESPFQINSLRSFCKTLLAFDKEAGRPRSSARSGTARSTGGSLRPQAVWVAGHAFDFAEGETIHTENSHKFSVDGFLSTVCDGGWGSHDVWSDPASFFSN